MKKYRFTSAGKWRQIFVAFVQIVFLWSCGSDSAPVRVTQLRCQDRDNPEGVERVLLSWKIESDLPAIEQTAWEIEIASSAEKLAGGRADVWRSGEQPSDRQLDIEPSGVSFQSGELYWWRVRIRVSSGEQTGWSAPASFSLAPRREDPWQARWITAEWSDSLSMPYFRKEFDVSPSGKKPVRALVYLSGLGCSDLYLNGKPVDETRILDPAQTNYEQYAFYSVFNVTSLLRKGKNCIGVMLGDGWDNQDVVWGKGFSYGKPVLFLQMKIFYADGSGQVIGSDESWSWTAGPVVSSNIYAGEVYDANREIPGWAEAGADPAGWRPVVLATEGVLPQQLRPQLLDPIRLQEEITLVDVWQNPDGTWIFDYGVNVAAIPRITVTQPKGTRLKMRMGECLKDDKTVDYGTTGVFATGVIQTDEYICSGRGVETWTPRFTYHGFRYLELSGAIGLPDKSWIKAVTVYTDVQPSGHFECSDPQINRLHEMAVRTMLANIHGLPTDCPHRERCGWLGDAHAVAPFENLNYNMHHFWLKYLEDIRSTSSVFLENTLHQKLYNSEFYFADKQPGIPFMIAPGRRLCGVASPDWGTAVVQLPWFTWLYYGDFDVLQRHYPEMKQWVDHVDMLAEGHIVPYGLGDWCPPEGNGTIDCPIHLSSTLFHYYDASIVARVAELLGRHDDAARYARLKDETGKALLNRFFDREKHTFGSQTADAMALDFGVIPVEERKAVSDAIVRNIRERRENFFHVGIFGLGRIGQALSRYGNAKTAWEIFTKKGENSFEWMWTGADATTLWEILPVNEKSKALCLGGSSLSHPMQANYDAWFYEDIAGIRPDFSGPGYKVIRFEPALMEYPDWAKASVETPYGRASSDWSRRNGKCTWRVTIPPNTSGLVALPENATVEVNGATPCCPVAEEQDGRVLYRFPSGKYTFSIE